MTTRIPYQPPALNLDAYNCPHCHAYARQSKDRVLFGTGGTFYTVVRCTNCTSDHMWRNATGDQAPRLIDPESYDAPPSHDDLPAEIRRDYEEAASILSRSPRGAAALLRLAVQKLCGELGYSGNLDEMIASMVAKGLDPTIQKALDVVRVIGNNAVHPGTIDLKDDTQTALALFGLVNEITEAMIGRPKRIEQLFGGLPQGAREAIDKRNSKALGSQEDR